MSVEKARLVLQLFEEALEVPPERRVDWVREACNNDAELAAEINSLLAVHDAPSAFLETAVQPVDLGHLPLPPAITVGQQIGDFIIERQIGAGGMGLVYRARQVSLNRPVALKLLPPHLRYSLTAQSRFQREVEAAARLSHPHIVAVYTSGHDDNSIYYAMELIEGPSLSEMLDQLRKHPPTALQSCDSPSPRSDLSVASTRAIAGDMTPPPGELLTPKVDLLAILNGRNYFGWVAETLADVADGLHYAHSMNVIHRDVKPSNLLLSSHREIHIGDFGLARVAHEPGLTRTGEVMGTPFYMAPEQISAAVGPVDARTDVYSLGVTLYELLTLRTPFAGEHREQVISQIMDEEPVPPKLRNRSAPRDLQTICLKSLEKNPARRYQSARELANDLRYYAAGRPITAQPLSPLGRCARWAGRRRNWAAAIAGIALLAIATGFFAYRSHVSEARWTDAQFASLFETAQLAALEGDLNRAATAIDKAEKLGAPAPQLLLLRGQLNLQAGRFQDACDQLEQAHKHMPKSVTVHALLANAYQSNEEHEKAAAVVSTLDTFQPVTLQDYLLLGQAQFTTDFERALETLDRAVQLDKTSVQARLTRGSVLVERAMDTASAELAERALQDLEIARALLEPNFYLLGNIVYARLVAATAYEVAGDQTRRLKHLDEAGKVAKALEEFPEQYQSHRWRALYYDYIGDDDNAIAAWQQMKEWQIALLVLTLFRHDRCDEAIKLCDHRLTQFDNARSTQFFRSLVLSASADSSDVVREAFTPLDKETLDALNAHRFHYAFHCVLGDLSKARAESQEFRAFLKSGSLFDPWRPHLLAYTCGEIDEDELLKRSAHSRIALCQAHFYIGMTRLAAGDRETAQGHYSQCAQYRILSCLEDYMSRAFLAHLERNPEWPKWIPAM